jgi:hypothetical protein
MLSFSRMMDKTPRHEFIAFDRVIASGVSCIADRCLAGLRYDAPLEAPLGPFNVEEQVHSSLIFSIERSRFMARPNGGSRKVRSHLFWQPLLANRR